MVSPKQVDEIIAIALKGKNLASAHYDTKCALFFQQILDILSEKDKE